MHDRGKGIILVGPANSVSRRRMGIDGQMGIRSVMVCEAVCRIRGLNRSENVGVRIQFGPYNIVV